MNYYSKHVGNLRMQNIKGIIVVEEWFMAI